MDVKGRIESDIGREGSNRRRKVTLRHARTDIWGVERSAGDYRSPYALVYRRKPFDGRYWSNRRQQFTGNV